MKRHARLFAGHPRFAAKRARGGKRISNLLPMIIGTRGEDHEPRSYESLQSDDPGSGL
jgi:hypothetical protein